MKKVIFMLVLSLACLEIKAQTPYIGGSVTLAYTGGFNSDTHFYGGYEFNDKWALGGCVGLNMAANDSAVIAGGFLGAYLRFTPWHNDILYTDIKWRTEVLLRDAIGVAAADVGLCGSLRFRLNDHIDIFTDFIPVGVRYSGGDTFPLIGILGSGCSLGMHYRF